MDKDRVEILFRFGHLPTELQIVSRLFYNLAVTLTDGLPSTPERTLALRALWDAQKLAVFAKSEALEPNRKGAE